VKELAFAISTNVQNATIGVLKMTIKKAPSKNKHRKLYSKGDQNYIIDSAVHPLAEKNSLFIVADEVLHVIVEKDVAVSAQKFVKYTVPYLLKRYAENRGRLDE
jgi:hypothetical protein